VTKRLDPPVTSPSGQPWFVRSPYYGVVFEEQPDLHTEARRIAAATPVRWRSKPDVRSSFSGGIDANGGAEFASPFCQCIRLPAVSWIRASPPPGSVLRFKSDGEPMVRIHLSPAGSQERTPHRRCTICGVNFTGEYPPSTANRCARPQGRGPGAPPRNIRALPPGSRPQAAIPRIWLSCRRGIAGEAAW
jgi:hypothetical protein